jgi:hypothetical protein
MSLAQVQALMGHATPIMTLEYARLFDDALLAARQHSPQVVTSCSLTAATFLSSDANCNHGSI